MPKSSQIPKTPQMPKPAKTPNTSNPNTPTSIQTIEQTLKTTANKSEQKRLKTNLNKLYAENKNQILEFEKTNYTYLALIRSTYDFYKMFGHSALFYAENIAKKLNLEAILRADHDFCVKSDTGVVSIKNLEALTKNLKTLNIQKLKTKNQTGDFVVYKLPWTFTNEQIEELKENNQLKIAKFNHLVLVEDSTPTLFVQLSELLKATHENTRLMPGPLEREVFGEVMLKSIKVATIAYMQYGNGKINYKTTLKTIKTELENFKYRKQRPTKESANILLKSPVLSS